MIIIIFHDIAEVISQTHLLSEQSVARFVAECSSQLLHVNLNTPSKILQSETHFTQLKRMSSYLSISTRQHQQDSYRIQIMEHGVY